MKRSETIKELPDRRWLNCHTGRYHKTAWHALRAVQRRDKATAKGTQVVITTITWEPLTLAGRAAVKALSAG